MSSKWKRDDARRRQLLRDRWKAADELERRRCKFDSAHTGEPRHVAHRDLEIPIKQDHDGRHLLIGARRLLRDSGSVWDAIRALPCKPWG